MQLRLQHLSGSRAGEDQTYEDSAEILVGRLPSMTVQFDPERDRAVSGRHASIIFEQGQWLLRDLGSSNGTFVNEGKITEHVLRNGETIQFGAHGPKVKVIIDSGDVAQQYASAASEAPSPMVPEGRTVMMMMTPQGGAPAGVSTAPAYTAPRRKKGGIGRALLIVGSILVVLLIGLVAIAFMIRSSNVKKNREAQQAQTATEAASTDTATATETSIDTATSTMPQVAEAEQLKQQLAQQQAVLEKASEKTTSGNASSAEVEDLKRQIAESQALIEQMTRQLQQKNDDIAAANARTSAANAKASTAPKVVYVPASPAPAMPSTPAQTAPAPTAPPKPAPSQGTRPTTSPTPIAPSVPAAATAELPPATNLITGKKLKVKLTTTSVPAEIPPANMPPSTDRELVNLIGIALQSTGDYVIGQKGQATVSVTVTNYKADVNKNVDTKKAVDSGRKLGKLFGQNVPSNPVDVKSVAYDAAMSARVKLTDPIGRVLAQTESSAASADRKTKTAIAGVNFRDVALSDTAVGDVARKVIGDAVDALRGGLQSLAWNGVIMTASKDKIVLGVGASANVEPGDVFDIIENGKPVARVRVASVTESSSEALYLAPPPKKFGAITARYLGCETAPTIRNVPRTLTIRTKTQVFNGPGNSFQPLKELKVGTTLNLQFTVGTWGKATLGTETYWVPLVNANINS